MSTAMPQALNRSFLAYWTAVGTFADGVGDQPRRGSSGGRRHVARFAWADGLARRDGHFAGAVDSYSGGHVGGFAREAGAVHDRVQSRAGGHRGRHSVAVVGGIAGLSASAGSPG